MINIEKVEIHKCFNKPCDKRALYQFTDAKEVEVNISYANGDEDTTQSSYETVTLGYSCEHSVEEVNKTLKKLYKK